jgi:hypothetical protein
MHAARSASLDQSAASMVKSSGIIGKFQTLNAMESLSSSLGISGKILDPEFARLSQLVIPAKAGIQRLFFLR